MICSKLAANTLGLSKQDNTNGTCATDVEQIIIWLANNTVKKITVVQSQQPHRDHANETTPIVYADDTGQIIM